MRGTFITLEGIDGSGKTTQAEVLVGQLRAAGLEVVALREPGGTNISEQIRSLLLDPANSEMAPEAELLLYEASRAQLVKQVIEPALASGAWVVCDRFFDSTTAYQAAGRALDGALVSRANALGSCGVTPDLTIVFDMDPALALARATQQATDRLEAEGIAFQARVREGYRALAAAEPARVRLLDATDVPDAVAVRLWSEVAPLVERALATPGAQAADKNESSVAHNE